MPDQEKAQTGAEDVVKDDAATPAPENETAPKSGDESGADASKSDTAESQKTEPPTIKFPEGTDKSVTERFAALFADVEADKAQKIVDAWAEQTAAADAALDQQIKAWETEITSIPEHKQLLASGKRAVDFIADEGFAELVNTTWFGSHPAVVKALARFGDLLGDDQQVEGARTHGGEKSLADRLFG